MVERLLQPDRTMGNAAQNKAYNGGGTGSLDVSKDASVKDFYFVQKFSAKNFDTKSYDSKNFWMGDFQFATKAADVKHDSKADKAFDTKTMPVKDAREAGKVFKDQDSKFATRESPIRGKTSQNHLDETNKGGSEQMNIDEVRDLLNKPRLN